MSLSTPPRATPWAQNFGSGSMRSSTAKRRSSLTTSCWAPSRTCWRSAALATTFSASTRASPSPSRRPAACATTSRKGPTLAPRLAGSCATRSSSAFAPSASWRRCARWLLSASPSSGCCCARSAPTRT
eukprot:3291415-Pleurochrysis_carterae.AAC.1